MSDEIEEQAAADGTGGTEGADGDAVEDRGSPPLADAVGEFLRDFDAAYDDYERGYADADATLSVVQTHVQRLREARDSE
jgi:hypothetical protein